MNTVNLIGEKQVGRSDLRLARWDLGTGDLQYRTHWGFDVGIPDCAVIWHDVHHRYGCAAIATPFGASVALVNNGMVQRFLPLRLAAYSARHANRTVAHNAIALARSHGVPVFVLVKGVDGLALISADELQSRLDEFAAAQPVVQAKPAEQKPAADYYEFEARAKFERSNKISTRIVGGTRRRRNARRRLSH